MSFCSARPHPPLYSLARGAVVWWRVGFGVGAGALQEADSHQLCVGGAGGGAGAGEELGSLALPGRGLPWTLVTLGDAGGVWIRFTGERGLSSPAGGGGCFEARGAGTAQGRSGDLWGFSGKGCRTAKGFCLPLICRSAFCCCKGESGSLRSSPAPLRPVSEVIELEDPVRASLT